MARSSSGEEYLLTRVSTSFSSRHVASRAPRTVGPKTKKTLSQARLLSLLPHLAIINMDILTQSHHPDVEKGYGLEDEGLLDFAAVHMVDFKDDILMAMSLIDFYAALLKVEPESESSFSNKPPEDQRASTF